jgi:beta-galactosidase
LAQIFLSKNLPKGIYGSIDLVSMNNTARSHHFQVGVRRVEIHERQLRVNGRPVLMKGVNRHEHDERRGKAVPESVMLADVLLMKQLNFNAVRCSHYPNATRWCAP